MQALAQSEARREVVSQILDYAKELSRWSSSDVQREVGRRLKRDGNPLLDIVPRSEISLSDFGLSFSTITSSSMIRNNRTSRSQRG